jgi:two-component system, NarL family, invasion response regulator UvrY
MRVLLVEDHQILRQGIIACLNREFTNSVFGEAGSIREARAQMRASWDVVLMDLGLPDGSGFELLSHTKREYPATKVVVLTSWTEEDCGLPALREGADAFVTKTAPISDLAKAIRAVAEGRRYFSAALVDRVLNATSHREKIGSRFSARELDTLRLSAEGLSTAEIGSNLNISTKTVETYRARICEKLEIHGIAAFLRYAILNQPHGYSDVSPEPSPMAKLSR